MLVEHTTLSFMTSLITGDPVMPDPAFNPKATDYYPANALLLARSASLVYNTDESAVRKTLKSWGFPRCRAISVGSTQLFVAGNDQSLIAAFRGTEKNLEDWLSDAKVKLTGGPLGMIHEGFGLALSSVWAQTLEAIKDYQDKAQGLWITGHSLGAALATLATARFLEKPMQIPNLKTDVRGLYTFGSPRVGNGDFATKFDELFKSKTFRFVNNRDIVTRVAPHTLMGYSHVGQVYYIDQDGVLHTDPKAWDMFMELVKATVSNPFILQISNKNINAIDDHSMDGYVLKIENQIKKLASPQG
jgi:triacylglycerol lipase